LSFQAIAEDERLPVETRLELTTRLSKAAAKMVVGQQLDLEAEGKEVSLEEIENIHLNKTGALIAFSATSGATIAGVDPRTFGRVNQFASKLGLLFQVTDDLLDVTGSTFELGKTAGKDEASGKATYPGRLGIKGTRDVAEQTYAEALAAIEGLLVDTSQMTQIGRFLLDRES